MPCCANFNSTLADFLKNKDWYLSKGGASCTGVCALQMATIRNIGIENIGSERHLLTKSQLKANEQLIRYLTAKHPQVEYLIGHYEYRKFEHSPLWKETDHAYRTVKSDPGIRFMRKIRKNTADLKLKAIP